MFDALAFDEFLTKLETWQAHPLKQLTNLVFGGNSDKKAFMRAGEVGNLVGNEIQQRISTTPHTSSIGFDARAVPGADPRPDVQLWK